MDFQAPSAGMLVFVVRSLVTEPVRVGLNLIRTDLDQAIDYFTMIAPAKCRNHFT